MIHSPEWIYEGREVLSIEDIPNRVIGFVYRVEDIETGKIYVGKKILFTNRKKRLTKQELLELEPKRGKKPTFKREIKESDWKDYYGSSKPLLAEIKTRNKLEFRRKILKFCYTKKQLSYWEVYYQVKYEVIHSREKSYNENILGKFYYRDIEETLD
jgi:hypothetical protein